MPGTYLNGLEIKNDIYWISAEISLPLFIWKIHLFCSFHMSRDFAMLPQQCQQTIGFISFYRQLLSFLSGSWVWCHMFLPLSLDGMVTIAVICDICDDLFPCLFDSKRHLCLGTHHLAIWGFLLLHSFTQPIFNSASSFLHY